MKEQLNESFVSELPGPPLALTPLNCLFWCSCSLELWAHWLRGSPPIYCSNARSTQCLTHSRCPVNTGKLAEWMFIPACSWLLKASMTLQNQQTTFLRLEPRLYFHMPAWPMWTLLLPTSSPRGNLNNRGLLETSVLDSNWVSLSAIKKKKMSIADVNNITLIYQNIV